MLNRDNTADNYLMDTRPNQKYTGTIYMWRDKYNTGYWFWKKSDYIDWFKGNPLHWFGDFEITSDTADNKTLVGTFFPVYLEPYEYYRQWVTADRYSLTRLDYDLGDNIINALMEDDWTDYGN